MPSDEPENILKRVNEMEKILKKPIVKVLLTVMITAIMTASSIFFVQWGMEKGTVDVKAHTYDVREVTIDGFAKYVSNGNNTIFRWMTDPSNFTDWDKILYIVLAPKTVWVLNETAGNLYPNDSPVVTSMFFPALSSELKLNFGGANGAMSMTRFTTIEYNNFGVKISEKSEFQLRLPPLIQSFKLNLTV
jgi:hypothetical protein